MQSPPDGIDPRSTARATRNRTSGVTSRRTPGTVGRDAHGRVRKPAAEGRAPVAPSAVDRGGDSAGTFGTVDGLGGNTPTSMEDAAPIEHVENAPPSGIPIRSYGGSLAANAVGDRAREVSCRFHGLRDSIRMLSDVVRPGGAPDHSAGVRWRRYGTFMNNSDMKRISMEGESLLSGFRNQEGRARGRTRKRGFHPVLDGISTQLRPGLRTDRIQN
jgi:hypothetical protein